MDKKSQVTVFIIMGIMIVIIASITFFAVNNRWSSEDAIKKSYEISTEGIKSHVQDCLDKSTKDAIVSLSLAGGDASTSNESIDYEAEGKEYTINYAYNGKKTFGTKGEMKMRLESSIDAVFRNCIDFSVFEDQGYEIESGFSYVSADLNENSVKARLFFPTTITIQDSTTELGDFSTTVEARLGHIITIVEKVADDLKDEPDAIHTTLLNSFDVTFDVLKYDQDTVIYVLTDEKSDIDGTPLVFMFGARQ